jgi:hypothetical protein
MPYIKHTFSMLVFISTIVFSIYFFQQKEFFLSILFAALCAYSALRIVYALVASDGILYVLTSSKQLRDMFDKEYEKIIGKPPEKK